MALSTDSFTGDHVLVTGGAGFIGGHLVRTLTSHAVVTVLDRDASSSVPDDLRHVRRP